MLVEQMQVHCSFCDSTDVEIYSSFGTAQLVRQYYCHCCHSVFEFIRWQEKETVIFQKSS